MGADPGNGRPPFVVVEGLDGSGTTTQSRLLVERLRDEEIGAVRTREPSEGPVGSLIRQILSGRVVGPRSGESPDSVSREVLALLFAADRLDHVAAEVEPALERGQVVVSDRYYYSSFVYQADPDPEGGFDATWVRRLNERARRPDLVVYLRAPVDICLERLEARGRRDRYETADELRELEERYEEIFREETDEEVEVVELDATRPVDAVHESVYQAVLGAMSDA